MYCYSFKTLVGVFVLIGMTFIQCRYCSETSHEDSKNQSAVMTQELEVKPAVGNLIISSSAFEPSGFIPAKYTCDGINVNPPLHIGNLPAEVQSLVLIVDDPDAPSGTWVHWVVWNIAPSPFISQNTRPGTEGTNDFGSQRYGGPCPPSGTHRYFFKVYALDNSLELPAGASKRTVLTAMEGHLLAQGELMGRYKRG